MKPFVGSRILFARAAGLGRPQRIRSFLALCATATVLLGAVWAGFAWINDQPGLLIADLALIALGAAVLALLGAGWVSAAIHVLLLGLLLWIAAMAYFISGSGVNHDGAVHYWLFVVVIGLHFVLFDAGRTLQTFYMSVSILLFVVIEYELIPLEPRFGFPEYDRLFSHGLTLGLVFIALWLMMRRFIASLSDAEQRAADANDRSRQLLHSMLPASVAARLERDGTTFAERYPATTILFADIVGFTPLASRLAPEALVQQLNDIFRTFDDLAARRDLEKTKTIGDGYMVVAGVPQPRSDHVEACAQLALDMLEAIRRFDGIQIRIGIHSGSTVAGIIGRTRLSFDVWGDAVNVASRLESSCPPGCIQVSRAVYDALAPAFVLESRGSVTLKGAGEMETFLLRARREPGRADRQSAQQEPHRS